MNDKKDAVLIGTNLSNQLSTAALAMLAIMGGVHTYIIENRIIDTAYYFAMGLSFLIFIVSIFCGGKGINQAREDGFLGKWNLTNTRKFFNMQAAFCFIGILLFISGLLLTESKTNPIYDEFKNISGLLEDLHNHNIEYDKEIYSEIVNLNKNFKSLLDSLSYTDLNK